MSYFSELDLITDHPGDAAICDRMDYGMAASRPAADDALLCCETCGRPLAPESGVLDADLMVCGICAATAAGRRCAAHRRALQDARRDLDTVIAHVSGLAGSLVAPAVGSVQEWGDEADQAIVAVYAISESLSLLDALLRRAVRALA